MEADKSGRFFVTGQAEPGAKIWIYLNDTPLAMVKAATDGAFGMTIEKGMTPGDYRVRVDDIEAISGKVLTRAEVPFTMAGGKKAPAQVAVAKKPRAPKVLASRDIGASSAPVAPASPPAPPSTSTPVQPASPASTAEPASLPAETAKPTPPSSDVQPAVARSKPAPASKSAEVPARQRTVAEVPNTAQVPPAVAEQSMPASPPPALSLRGEGAATAPSSAEPAAGPAAALAASNPDGPTPSVAVIPEIKTVTVVRGDNLWRISRKTYGRGTRYTIIYGANTNQIRNPHRIYPGQIFVTPEDKG